MKCYRNQHEVGIIGDAVRYCTECGVVLFQSCPYCDKGVSVYESRCPHAKCGQPFVYCPDCYVLYRIDRTVCDNPRDGEQKCGKYLEERLIGFHSVLANLERANAIYLPLELESNNASVNSLAMANGGGKSSIVITPTDSNPISAVISRHGWLFYGTRTLGTRGRSEQGRVRALDLQTQRDAWTGSPSRDLQMASALVTAYPRFIVSRTERFILVDSILDGQQITRIDPAFLDFQEALIGDSLLVLGRDDQGRQKILRYDLSLGGQFQQEVEVSLAPQHASYRVPPVVTHDSCYFVDLHNRVVMCDALGQWAIIWSNSQQYQIDQIAIDGNQLYLLVFDQQHHSLLSLCIGQNGGPDEDARIHLKQLPLDMPQFSIFEGNVLLSSQNELAAYRITRPYEPYWTHRTSPQNTLHSYFVLVGETQSYVIFLLRINTTPNHYTVRWVTMADDCPESNFDPAVSMSLSSHPTLSYAAGYVLACDTQRGRIDARRFPL